MNITCLTHMYWLIFPYYIFEDVAKIINNVCIR